MSKRTIMGKNSGATVEEDGKISIAPMYRDEFDSIARRTNAIYQFHKMTMAFCQEELAQIEKDKTILWRRVAGDLDLDFSKINYSYSNGTLEPIAMANQPQPDTTEGK